MMRIALGIEYDGSGYYGWQLQKNGVPTIQEKIEIALSQVANQPITVIAAGRTDAGVHAVGQIAHFDTEVNRSERAWVLGSNSNLPPDIRILWARQVDPDFHARYSARVRHYRYLIYNHPVASALLRHRAMWWLPVLNEKLMYEGGQYLIGEHDFSSFRGSGCQSKSVKRRIELLTVTRAGAMVNIDIKANAFLLHMVRNIVGVLLKIGGGECSPIWAQEVLQACDRRKAGVTASALGLYLVSVSYNQIFLGREFGE